MGETDKANGAYVIVRGEYSDWNIVGLFMSEEAANRFIMENNAPGEEPVYCAGFYDFMDDEIMKTPAKQVRYLTKFYDKGPKGSSKHVIALGDTIQEETMAYDSDTFEFHHPWYEINGYGIIVLDRVISNRDKLLRIIIDKVFKQLTEELEVITDTN